MRTCSCFRVTTLLPLLSLALTADGGVHEILEEAACLHHPLSLTNVCGSDRLVLRRLTLARAGILEGIADCAVDIELDMFKTNDTAVLARLCCRLKPNDCTVPIDLPSQNRSVLKEFAGFVDKCRAGGASQCDLTHVTKQGTVPLSDVGKSCGLLSYVSVGYSCVRGKDVVSFGGADFNQTFPDGNVTLISDKNAHVTSAWCLLYSSVCGVTVGVGVLEADPQASCSLELSDGSRTANFSCSSPQLYNSWNRVFFISTSNHVTITVNLSSPSPRALWLTAEGSDKSPITVACGTSAPAPASVRCTPATTSSTIPVTAVTAAPTNGPTNTAVPTNGPTNTAASTQAPTNTAVPTNTPTNATTPTNGPTNTTTPTNAPTNTTTPTNAPTTTAVPTNTPTNATTPTNGPTNTTTPTNAPTNATTPTNASTKTAVPTNAPTNATTPTNAPTKTAVPTNTPTNTAVPTNAPTTTAVPTNAPTNATTPTNASTKTAVPTNAPTNATTPTNAPTKTAVPTNTPTNTAVPTNAPTTTAVPTNAPTNTTASTNAPTTTAVPTNAPTTTAVPTNAPTTTAVPTNATTNATTATNAPTTTAVPTNAPTTTAASTNAPTNTAVPTNAPTNTTVPTNAPTNTTVPNTAATTPLHTDTPAGTTRETSTNVHSGTTTVAAEETTHAESSGLALPTYAVGVAAGAGGLVLVAVLLLGVFLCKRKHNKVHSKESDGQQQRTSREEDTADTRPVFGAETGNKTQPRTPIGPAWNPALRHEVERTGQRHNQLPPISVPHQKLRNPPGMGRAGQRYDYAKVNKPKEAHGNFEIAPDYDDIDRDNFEIAPDYDDVDRDTDSRPVWHEDSTPVGRDNFGLRPPPFRDAGVHSNPLFSGEDADDVSPSRHPAPDAVFSPGAPRSPQTGVIIPRPRLGYEDFTVEEGRPTPKAGDVPPWVRGQPNGQQPRPEPEARAAKSPPHFGQRVMPEESGPRKKLVSPQGGRRPTYAADGGLASAASPLHTHDLPLNDHFTQSHGPWMESPRRPDPWQGAKVKAPFGSSLSQQKNSWVLEGDGAMDNAIYMEDKGGYSRGAARPGGWVQ